MAITRRTTRSITAAQEEAGSVSPATLAHSRDVSEKMLSAAESSRKRGTEKAASGQGPLKKAKAAAFQGWVAWKDGDGNEFLAERPVRIKDKAGSKAQDPESDQEDDVTILKVTSVNDPVASVDLSDESEDNKTTADKPPSSSAASTPAPHDLATNTDELDRYRTTKKVSATRAFEPGICLACHEFNFLLLQFVDEALAAQPPGTRHEFVLELKMQPAVFDLWYQCAAGDEQLWQATTSHVRTQVNIVLMRMKRQEEEKKKAEAVKVTALSSNKKEPGHQIAGSSRKETTKQFQRPAFCPPHLQPCALPPFCPPHLQPCAPPPYCPPHLQPFALPPFCPPHLQPCAPPPFCPPHLQPFAPPPLYLPHLQLHAPPLSYSPHLQPFEPPPPYPFHLLP